MIFKWEGAGKVEKLIELKFCFFINVDQNWDEMTPEWSQKNFKMILRSKNHLKIIQRWSNNESIDLKLKVRTRRSKFEDGSSDILADMLAKIWV